MIQPQATLHESYPDTHHDIYSKTVFGFWVYLVTDFMLFASLFAAYIVLRNNTFGGPSSKDIFELTSATTQSVILLTSSLTSGLAGAFAHRKNKQMTILLFALTFLLGIVFTWMELKDLTHLIQGGNSWQRSAFLSMVFTVIGTHALHMFFALLWLIALIIPVCIEGVSSISIRRLTCLKMFWQFLNMVWIFIFTIVYFT